MPLPCTLRAFTSSIIRSKISKVQMPLTPPPSRLSSLKGVDIVRTVARSYGVVEPGMTICVDGEMDGIVDSVMLP